jgi:predicted acyl esterase
MNTSLLLPMRDNVTLFSLLFLPDDIPSPIGTVLIRTPYDTSSQAPLCAALADIGFACLVADERGKHQSGGAYTMWASASNDTADTIAFLVAQPWSNKRFAWTGGSANAIMGFVEPLQSSPLGLMKAQFNLVGTARLKGLEYQDGAFREELIQNWLIENDSPEFIPIVKAHERWSPFWTPTTAQPAQWGLYTWPTLHLAGFYDIFSSLQINDALAMDAAGGAGARGGQIVIIEAGGHCAAGAVAWPNASWGETLAENYQITLYEATIGAPAARRRAAPGGRFSAAAVASARATMQAIRARVGAISTIFIWYLMGSGGPGDVGNIWAAGSREFFRA